LELSMPKASSKNDDKRAPHRDAMLHAVVNDQREIGGRITYSIDEVAELLGISRTSVYECVRRGEIPARRFGRRLLVMRAEFEQILLEPGQTDGSTL
jgi:excisionase family DNA binding protein